MRRLSGSRGATLVEFALIVPLFLLLVLGTIDMGRYMAATASVNTAARESARYGSSVGLNADSLKRYLDCDGIIAEGVGYGAGIDFQAADFTITYDHGPADTTAFDTCPAGGSVSNPSGIGAGDRVVVSVSRPFSMVSPMVDVFFGSITITSVDRRTLLSS
jgi:Flp pilus assembly protein TadG